jgi:hypothetical protein
MAYTIYDTGNSSTSICERLDDAIQVVNNELIKEEREGRIIDREREGRWAIYDGPIIKLLWIETDSGSVVSFSR